MAMPRARLFALAVLVPAAFGFASLLVTRWGFRSWPQGSYVWIPLLITVAELAMLVLLGRALGAEGLPFGLAVTGWYVGRIAGAAASSLVAGVGLDASLLDSASFGALAVRDGGVVLAVPSLAGAVLPLAALALAYAWGRRGARSSAVG